MMGVVFISSSAARSPLRLNTDLLTHRSSLKKLPSIVAFKADESTNSSLIVPPEQVSEKQKEKRVVTRRKPSKDQNSAPLGLDYNEAAARLESIYKLSPPATSVEEDVIDASKGKVSRRRKRKESGGGEEKKVVVRSNVKKEKRLNLDKRIALKRNVQEKPVIIASAKKKVTRRQQEEEKIERLVRDYSASNDVVSLDWKKMKIPPVLSSTEHTWLFKLMQPMKVLSYYIYIRYFSFFVSNYKIILIYRIRYTKKN